MHRTASILALGLIGWSAIAVAQNGPPTPATTARQREATTKLNMADRRDFDRVGRGYLGTRADPVIRTADGKVAWDLRVMSFVDGPAPPTVNPSLWRQQQLLARHGLFQLAKDVYQVRGFDLANVTFVRGATGWLVIDPLSSNETARAAYELLCDKVERRPVTGIFITHSHGDHYRGIDGVRSAAVPNVPIVAPADFMQASVSESVIAGPAMWSRARYQIGRDLPVSPTGSVGVGLGMGVSAGTQSAVPHPTVSIARSDEKLTVDGVAVEFQITSGTEAPSEFNVAFPALKVVNIAENANASQHNILTPRGAQVRDAKAWAGVLDDAVTRFGDYEVLATSHTWPRFGRAEIREYLSKQRDAFAFLHDQTVRLMNQGKTGEAIAASLTLPDALAREWYNRPYYGDFAFNTRAVYQFYMGFFDGNPVHLRSLAPADMAGRYVAALGGAGHVRDLAQQAFDGADYRWAAELFNQAVFANPGDTAARLLLARCYDQLAWQSENALHRNFYLSGAADLRRSEIRPRAAMRLSPETPVASIFDVLATRLDPARLGDRSLRLGFVFSDGRETVEVDVENGVLIHRPARSATTGRPTMTVERGRFIATLNAGTDLASLARSGQASISGRAADFATFGMLFEAPLADFAIITPQQAPARP